MTEPKRAPGGFPVVGVVGGGQLARMMQGPAIELGVQLSVLAEDEVASAALVIPSSPVGRHTELDHVLDFARSCDVVTFDHEHVPQHVLQALESEGIVMRPSRSALRFAQDKLAMRERLSELGIACPRWAVAREAAHVERFGEEVGWPVIVKTPRGGYDGKGVIVASSTADAESWLAHVGEPGPMSDGLLLEERVEFTRELAALVARSPSGQAAAWMVVETVQTRGICTEVLAPAPDLDPGLGSRATEAALRIAGELDVTGVLAVELFEVPGPAGRPGYVVNELAMRPHNSGHWSMDGAVTGQFEQHLRAVLDLPLGDPRPRARWTAMANVLGGDYPDLYSAYRHVMARDPSAKVHMYGKGVRPGRKLGHVNVSGTDLADARERARHAADYLQGAITQ
ncbi:MAG TPA: 5-(carboxyamino)imidazole ribonucleotide synthase [Intrasporangium sp.]|uniref:5-(carboxyamino)imidazole ribonucleotide synthase n=1 Tax=Intrasporangium sp. TaxID=1925024 RepID=UPI002B45BBEB|nr:5-(carboxyamino)imidazole ribonucleotide synthase [Intrasporangium sp.]HKX68347.1 5-(carboxyamino)imidazole ribonucleotide synthase [Intrasporangium sp.]